MNRTLPRHPDPCDIALSTQKNRVYQWLWFVQVIEQENGGGRETKEDSQIVGREVLRQTHDSNETVKDKSARERSRVKLQVMCELWRGNGND